MSTTNRIESNRNQNRNQNRIASNQIARLDRVVDASRARDADASREFHAIDLRRVASRARALARARVCGVARARGIGASPNTTVTVYPYVTNHDPSKPGTRAGRRGPHAR